MTPGEGLILGIAIIGIGSVALAAFAIWMYVRQERRRHEGAANK